MEFKYVTLFGFFGFIISIFSVILDEFQLISGKLRLNPKIILATAHMEVTAHAPGVAIGVSDNPVWDILFFVEAPANQEDCVIQLLFRHFGARLG